MPGSSEHRPGRCRVRSCGSTPPRLGSDAPTGKFSGLDSHFPGPSCFLAAVRWRASPEAKTTKVGMLPLESSAYRKWVDVSSSRDSLSLSLFLAADERYWSARMTATPIGEHDRVPASPKTRFGPQSGPTVSRLCSDMSALEALRQFLATSHRESQPGKQM